MPLTNLNETLPKTTDRHRDSTTVPIEKTIQESTYLVQKRTLIASQPPWVGFFT